MSGQGKKDKILLFKMIWDLFRDGSALVSKNIACSRLSDIDVNWVFILKQISGLNKAITANHF